MVHFLKTLRPVGNRINVKFRHFNHELFYPFGHVFYQSGTAALAAALIASYRIKPHIIKPEVIIPAYGCPDLVSAIIYSGATPVLVDLEPNRPWMSTENILNAITSNSTALIAVNFLGIAERMETLRTICRDNNVILIEDSAQGFPVASSTLYWTGDFNIVSFGRGKPVNLLSGGAVLSKDQTLLDLLPAPPKATQPFVKIPKYLAKLFVYNMSINPFIYNIISRLPGLNIGETIFKPLPGIFDMPEHVTKLLAYNVDDYTQRANHYVNLYEYLSYVSCTQFINLASVTQHNLNRPLLRYPFLITNNKLRDKLFSKLKPYGSSLMYQKTLNEIEGVPQHLANPHNKFPNATSFANNLITLPLHNAISHADTKAIQHIFTKYLY